MPMSDSEIEAYIDDFCVQKTEFTSYHLTEKDHAIVEMQRVAEVLEKAGETKEKQESLIWAILLKKTMRDAQKMVAQFSCVLRAENLSVYGVLCECLSDRLISSLPEVELDAVAQGNPCQYIRQLSRRGVAAILKEGVRVWPEVSFCQDIPLTDNAAYVYYKGLSEMHVQSWIPEFEELNSLYMAAEKMKFEDAQSRWDLDKFFHIRGTGSLQKLKERLRYALRRRFVPAKKGSFYNFRVRPDGDFLSVYSYVSDHVSKRLINYLPEGELMEISIGNESSFFCQIDDKNRAQLVDKYRASSVVLKQKPLTYRKKQEYAKKVHGWNGKELLDKQFLWPLPDDEVSEIEAILKNVIKWRDFNLFGTEDQKNEEGLNEESEGCFRNFVESRAIGELQRLSLRLGVLNADYKSYSLLKKCVDLLELKAVSS